MENQAKDRRDSPALRNTLRAKIRVLLITIVVYQVSIVVLYARGFFQGVAALQTVDQVALDYPRPSEDLWVVN